MCGEKFGFNCGKVKDMAESKGSLIAKSVQKHAGRAKEKILQNLGKVDRTADDIFDEHLQNFTRQQNAANRLQKEFNNYIRCVRAVQTASKSLLDAVGEVYESQWSGHDLLFIQSQNVDMLWQDFSHKLGDQVLIPLNTYQAQFPEMRKKVDKRGRKLVDYDGQRHSFQALQASMAKKRDDVKITKGREQLDEAKRTYEMLNSELHDELPALHDSRVLFLVTNLQTLFSSEQVFHAETAKVYAELEAIVDKLATESQRGSYSMKKTNGSTVSPTKVMNSSPLIINNIAPASNNTNSPEDTPTTPAKFISESDKRNSDPPPSTTPPPVPLTPPPSADIPPATPSTPSPASSVPILNAPAPVEITTPILNGNGMAKPKVIPEPSKTPSPTPGAPDVPVVNNSAPTPNNNAMPPNNNSTTITTTPNNKHVEELYDIPVDATTENLPPGVLYRVKATYKYNREDVDELSFDVGETIKVIEYDDPEEQEEGWLMGMKEGSNEKGMFPANFTRPL